MIMIQLGATKNIYQDANFSPQLGAMNCSKIFSVTAKYLMLKKEKEIEEKTVCRILFMACPKTQYILHW